MKDVKGYLMESIGEFEEENDLVVFSEFILNFNIDIVDFIEVYICEFLIIV